MCLSWIGVSSLKFAHTMPSLIIILIWFVGNRPISWRVQSLEHGWLVHSVTSHFPVSSLSNSCSLSLEQSNKFSWLSLWNNHISVVLKICLSIDNQAYALCVLLWWTHPGSNNANSITELLIMWRCLGKHTSSCFSKSTISVFLTWRKSYPEFSSTYNQQSLNSKLRGVILKHG